VRTACLAAVLAGTVALVPTPGFATTVVVTATKGPSGIACPAAPSGWYFPAGTGKSVEAGPKGLQTAAVLCNYYTRGGKHIVVELNYALPTDPNPINFYYGCGAGGQNWDSVERVFRVINTQYRAIVAFTDPLHALKESDVPRFENVAQRLLQNSKGSAHDCVLNPVPTKVDSSRENVA